MLIAKQHGGWSVLVCVICYRAHEIVDDSISIVKESFDNNLTPYYALAISIWGPYMRVCLCLCTRHLHRKDNQPFYYR